MRTLRDVCTSFAGDAPSCQADAAPALGSRRTSPSELRTNARDRLRCSSPTSLQEGWWRRQNAGHGLGRETYEREALARERGPCVTTGDSYLYGVATPYLSTEIYLGCDFSSYVSRAGPDGSALRAPRTWGNLNFRSRSRLNKRPSGHVLVSTRSSARTGSGTSGPYTGVASPVNTGIFSGCADVRPIRGP